MRAPRRLSSGCSVLAGLLAATWVAAEPIPGTRIELRPPPGFELAQGFAGFENPDARASIAVSEIPGPLDRLRAGMTRESLARGGLELVDANSVEIGGRDALLLETSQQLGGHAFERWMLLLGDETRSAMVVASFPTSAGGSLREPMKAALLSVRWDPEAPIDPFAGLPFRLVLAEDLEIASRMANTLMLTRRSGSGSTSPGDPLLVVAAISAKRRIVDLEAFSRHRVAQIAEIEAVDNLAGRSRQVDELPAYELVADARDRASGMALRVYQLVVVDDDRYFLAQGLVGSKEAGRYLPRFRQVSEGLRRAD